MKILKSLIIAFSLYSKIPMPVFDWDEDNVKHAIAFLPLVGVVIGGLSYAMIKLAIILQLPVLFVTLILTAIPLLITGGFHVDGFMDVQDALHSYQPRERKLEIMKDPHIGAFAVISAGTVLLIWSAFLYLLIYKGLEKGNLAFISIYCISFALVRALCGITSISFPKAKADGMLKTETGKSGRGDLTFLCILAMLSLGLMLVINLPAGIVCAVALGVFCIFYRNLCKKNFGGVTGDTAGFFVVMGETLLVVALSIF